MPYTLISTETVNAPGYETTIKPVLTREGFTRYITASTRTPNGRTIETTYYHFKCACGGRACATNPQPPGKCGKCGR